ncbi:unnamed protein product [Thelazia callipaeda]|uniref:ZP domain-containing protein n=1 Tax=Thelazia callipaeda TaxID=103827 RepID=A0A3P7KGM0_THECL|nr:unnamed protein product [Thelazia callipaeda]
MSCLCHFFQGASVVNLPDRESVYFSCQVKLCFKKGDYCSDLTPPRCNIEPVGITTKSEVELKTIEEDLQNDQLLYTTTGPLATSKTVRIQSTGSPNTVPLSSSRSSPQSSLSSFVAAFPTVSNVSISSAHQASKVKVPANSEFRNDSADSENLDKSNSHAMHNIQAVEATDHLLWSAIDFFPYW